MCILGSFYLLGALPGNLLSNLISSRFGRRNTLLFSSVFIIGSWALIAAATNITMILIGRFLLGLFIGATIPACSLYIAEISHTDIRGSLMGFIQLTCTGGIVLSYLIGLGTNWYELAAVGACTPLLMIVTLPFLPKSPFWLLQKDRSEEALESMKKVRGSNYDFQKELDAMKEQLQKKPTAINLMLLLKWSYLKPLLIGLGTHHAVNMLGGVIFVTFAEPIFLDMGYEENATEYALYVGIAQMAGMALYSLIADKFERSTLMIVPSLLMAPCLVGIGTLSYLQRTSYPEVFAHYFPLPVILIYVFQFGFGIAVNINVVVMTEILPGSIRDIGTGIGWAFLFTHSFTMVQCYYPVVNAIGADMTYWIMGGLTIPHVLFYMFVLPKTKGLTLAEIENKVMKNKIENKPEP